MAGVAFDPFPFDLMLAERGIQALPEIDIFDRFFQRFSSRVFSSYGSTG
jgi:hypothetical protein